MREHEYNLAEIQDRVVRENFQYLREFIDDNIFYRFDGKHFEITFTKAETNLKYKHSLGFVPKDVMQTYVSDSGTVTWNFDDFDSTNLDITTDKACTVRAFIGRFGES